MSEQLHLEGLFGSTGELWDNVLQALGGLPEQRSHEEWLRDSRAIRLDRDELTVAAPHKFAKEFIEKRCLCAIEEAVEQLLGRRLQIRFVVADATSDAGPDTVPRTAAPLPRKHSPRPTAAPGMPLNHRYQFDTFVTGECSRFARAAAEAVAQSPGGLYNPLFLHGGVGIGKTHLLQSIAHELGRRHPGLRVAYVSADVFTYEFVSAIRERRCDAFRKRYRTLDVWLVDDVQFIAQKEATEEEFFLTFTALHEAGRQIVLASDRYPKDMNLIHDRLRSRLESGLIAEVGCPDLQTRAAVLRRKAAAEGVPLSDDVVFYVASLVDSNVRTLEGALIKLLAYSSLTRSTLTEAVARDALEGYLERKPLTRANVETIQRAVCDFYHVDIRALKGKRRDRPIALPRQVAMYLSREITGIPLAEIGQRFGGRDHSTVIAACNRVKAGLESNTELRNAVEELTRALRTDA